MHTLIERFTGRYQVWRDEREPYVNPLRLFAVIVAFGLAQAACGALFKRALSWRTVLFAATDILFLVLYFRRSPWAWLAMPLWGALILFQLPFTYSLAAHYPPRVILITVLFAIFVGTGLIVWGFAVRKRYYRFIDCE